jgi:B-box zinc finger protein
MPLSCARCERPLPTWQPANAGAVVCAECGSGNQVRVFPALLRPAGESRPEAAIEGEAACFDHPNKRAVAACSQCGRFLCRLCSVTFGEETWCPSCVALGAGKAKPARLDTSCNLYDSMALIVPLVSLVLWPLTIVAAPASLVLALMKWREPLSLVRWNRWRMVAAIAVSLVMIGLWGWGILYLVTRGKAST